MEKGYLTRAFVVCSIRRLDENNEKSAQRKMKGVALSCPTVILLFYCAVPQLTERQQQGTVFV